MATAIVAVSSIAFASLAQAQQVIGQLAPGNSPVAGCGALGPVHADLLSFEVQEGSDYTVPATGAIVSWSTNAAAGQNQTMGFKVFRPVTGNVFRVLGHDTRTLAPSTVNTFKTSIPVTQGDVIGLNTGNASPQTPNACEFAGSGDDDVILFPGDVADQGLTADEHLSDLTHRANVSAVFLPAPQVNVAGPVDLGSIKGGGTVVLSGANFAEVSAVSFGGAPASGFTVNSEQQITAVAPPGKTLDAIGAEVTTPAGTAVAPALFSYEGCLVPKLKGKKLKTAKAGVARSGCKLGQVRRVRGARSKRGKVVRQSPMPGKLLAPGSKVSVKVGR